MDTKVVETGSESNKSIIGRKVLCIEDRKVVGKVTDLRIDCESKRISYFIIKEDAVAFDKVVGVGNAFVTIEKNSDFAKVAVAKSAITRGFTLTGSPIYSRTGNEIGTVKEFAFDVATGNINQIISDSGLSFDEEAIEFFVPTFIMVDDSQAAAAPKPVKKSTKSAKKKEPVEQPAEDAMDEALFDIDEDEIPVDDSISEELQELLGLVLGDDVISEDGEFAAVAGTVLTQELIVEANAHNALNLLASVVEF